MQILRHLTFFIVLLALPVGAGAQEDLGQAARDWINVARAAEGHAALSVSGPLGRAAAGHAADMAARGYFSHTSADGSGIGDRVRRQGYRFCFVAENIAKGQGSLESVLRGWMASPGHRQNLLNEAAAEFGLMRGSGDIWVMVLGRDGC